MKRITDYTGLLNWYTEALPAAATEANPNEQGRRAAKILIDRLGVTSHDTSEYEMICHITQLLNEYYDGCMTDRSGGLEITPEGIYPSTLWQEDGARKIRPHDNATFPAYVGCNEFKDWAWAHCRELLRYAFGVYTPLKWKVFDLHAPFYLYAHVSKSDPALVAYTMDAKKLMQDVQTPIKPGRFIREHLAPNSSDHFIRDAANELLAQNASVQVKYSWDYEAEGFESHDDCIEWVYQHGPRSCMVFRNGMDGHLLPDHMFDTGCRTFSSNAHPCRVYAGPDTGVAYILGSRSDGKKYVVARTVVRHDTKQWIKIYGDDTYLKAGLDAAGYTHGDLEGVRLTLIEECGNTAVCPYLDGAEDHIVRENGYLLVVDSDHPGAIGGTECHGLVELTVTVMCDCCEETVEEDDVTEVHGGYCACERCLENYYTQAYVNTGLTQVAYVRRDDCYEVAGASYSVDSSIVHCVATYVERSGEYVLDSRVETCLVTGGLFDREDSEYIHAIYNGEEGEVCLDYVDLSDYTLVLVAYENGSLMLLLAEEDAEDVVEDRPDGFVALLDTLAARVVEELIPHVAAYTEERSEFMANTGAVAHRGTLADFLTTHKTAYTVATFGGYERYSSEVKEILRERVRAEMHPHMYAAAKARTNTLLARYAHVPSRGELLSLALQSRNPHNYPLQALLENPAECVIHVGEVDVTLTNSLSAITFEEIRACVA